MTTDSSRLPDRTPSPQERPNPAVAAVHAVERAASLDTLGNVVDALARVVAPSAVAPFLRGKGSGHALHPFLTDLPIGFWTSASVLDVVGGRSARGPARKLVGLGLLSVLPTAATGLAEWRQLGRPESRVATLHAGLNIVAAAGYGLSYALRRRERHGAGALAAFGAMGVATVSGYLGGHLTTARKVGSRDSAYDTDGVGPVLRRDATASLS
jgi:hypothetical protein